MKAILCSQYCQPDDLVLADIPDPVAEPGQAVIAIKSAALNFFDILMIQGKYQIKPPFPFSPAAEVAGVIESVGAGVTGLKVGDRVVASCGHNGAREKIALPANINREDSRQSGFRSRRRHHHHLRHRAARAGRSRQPEARRDACGAGRGRRHRPCGLRTRQTDGPEGDRLRIVGREARIRQGARRRTDAELRQGRPEGRLAAADRRQGRRHNLRSRRRHLCRSRLARRSPGKVASW